MSDCYAKSRKPRQFAWLLLFLLGGDFLQPIQAATKKYWGLSPYRVRIHIAIEDASQPQPQLGDQLASELRTQIRSKIYPLWKSKIALANGRERQQILAMLDQDGEPDAELFDTSELAAGCDKQIFLSLIVTPQGTLLNCRELDCTTFRWGGTQRRLVRQASMLPPNCLDILCQTFSPLAIIHAIADNEKEILLDFRGSDLPQQTDLSLFTTPGETYQPLMVRTNSAGEVQPDSIRDISWTFLSLGEHQDDGWHGLVHTGTRRPFGVRRRGRIEHYALALKKPSGATRVRFYARHDPDQGLTGYEVFRREPEATESEALGLTDTQGSVEVLPGDSKVTYLFLRSEGQLLAKVPVIPGATALVEVPIADDTSRLRAQSALTSLTEQLIDTVAMRNILIARVRDRIKNGNIDAAQELFTELDSLPGRGQFDQDIQSAKLSTLHQSKDPKVQARIEKLFDDTRKLLGRFLSTKPISELQGELTSARREKAS